MQNQIKLTQTIKENGRFKASGYVIESGHKFEFSLTEKTADQAFEPLRRLQHDIDQIRGGVRCDFA